MLNTKIHKPSFLKGVEVGRAIKRLQRVIEQPDIPDTPTQYLYGHVASADEKPDVIIDGVGYKGAVLPPLPETDLPYAMMFFTKKSISDPTPVKTLFMLGQKAEIGIANMVISGGGSVACYEIIGNGNEWQQVASLDTETGDIISVGNFSTAPTSSDNGWSNYDVLRQDGSVYMAKSDPIPVGEIVGYSYNGTVLPELPEWDKTVYPYAFIRAVADYGLYELYAFKTEPSWFRTFPFALYGVEDGNTYLKASHYVGHSEYWDYSAPILGQSALTEKTSNGYIQTVEQIVWSNFTVLNKDDSLCLAASEPIPVYE